MNDYIQRVGESWAEDNARFEAANPGLGAQLWRNINPLTGFGSTLGQMHKAAGEGDRLGMTLAALQALPALGVVSKAGSKTLGGIIGRIMPRQAAIRTARNVVEGGVRDTVLDLVGNATSKSQPVPQQPVPQQAGAGFGVKVRQDLRKRQESQGLGFHPQVNRLQIAPGPSGRWMI
jgi:hypothetical protein